MKKKNNPIKQSYILTRETLGMTILLFCVLVTLMLLTHSLVFASIGAAVCTFMYGTFGYASYLIIGLLAYLGVWLVFEKKVKIKVKSALIISALVTVFFLLMHTISTHGYALDSYGDYLAKCYTNAENGYSGYTAGGVISGILVYPIAKATTRIGAYVIFSVLFLFCAYLTFVVLKNYYLNRAIKASNAPVEEEKAQDEPVEQPAQAVDNLYSVNDNYEIVNNGQLNSVRAEQNEENAEPEPENKQQENLGRKILFENGEFAAESYRRNMIFNENSYFNHPVHNDGDYLSNFSSGNKGEPTVYDTYSSSYSKEVESGNEESVTPSRVYGDAPVTDLENFDTVEDSVYSVEDNAETPAPEASESEYARAIFEQEETQIEEPSEPEIGVRREESSVFNSVEETRRTEINEVSDRRDGEEYERAIRRDENNEEKSAPNIFNLFSSPSARNESNRIEPDTSRLTSRRESNSSLFDNDAPEQPEDNDIALNARGLRDGNEFSSREVGFTASRSVNENTEERSASSELFGSRTERNIPAPAPIKKEEPAPEEKPAEPEKPKHVWKKYVRPTLDLLEDYPENSNVNTAEIEDSKQIIVDTLANFKIASQISNVTVGPAITRYDVVIEDRTNIKNALKYRDAIAMALMKENVTAYLNYSKGAISIEVPNSSRTVVGLKGMLASSQFINCKPNTLTFALGKNVDGKVVCPDITKMPHLLVAGTTGSGKSICLSALIISLLYKYGPEELRFILVDPKQVEFISYDKLPHLMINEIIYDVDKAIKALNWAIKEMERRYQLFKEMTESGVATKNLTEYNAHLPEGEEKLPKIVIILDEFGDLMLQAKKDIESRIIRLVQKARACGIHLILATQRPSVDCITGLIKSNLPTRIGFKVNSFDDARTIFDIGGAEKLLGKGDLYFRSAESPDLARIQGCFVDTPEVQRVTDFVKKNNETYFDQSVEDFINTVEEPENEASSDDAATENDTKVDDTFIKALYYCVTSNQASVSMIQRRFPVGYIKACKIIDWMEAMNYITLSEGSKPRKVLLSKEEFKMKYGDMDD